MSYDNIKKLVSNTTKKTTILWTSVFLLNIFLITFYNINNKKTTFMENQLVRFTEINTEITSILYYNSQSDIIAEIDYSKTLLSQWLENNQQQYTNILPNAIPEIEHLSQLGTTFYSEKNLKEKNNQLQNFQNLSDQLELLKRLSQNYIGSSLFPLIINIMPLLGIGLLFILIFFTLLFSNSLQKKIVNKIEFILEDIWNELQDIELNEAHTINYNIEKEMPVKEPAFHKTQSILLTEEIKKLLSQVTILKEELSNYTNSDIDNSTTDGSQLQEKIFFIQKLLSRLFTRAERAASLAKASSDNGFQAGILALNVSIEAAKAGELGKNFVPISDRIKDFAEKSSQIGKAILEELKDVDLSIRKAYALGKSIIENVGDNSAPAKLPNADKLNYILDRFDHLFASTRSIQSIAIELENYEIPQKFSSQAVPSLKNTLFLKEVLIRSFERLYRFSYGIDPPTINNSFIEK